MFYTEKSFFFPLLEKYLEKNLMRKIKNDYPYNIDLTLKISPLLERFEKWPSKYVCLFVLFLFFNLTTLLFIFHLGSERGEAMNFSLFRFS